MRFTLCGCDTRHYQRLPRKWWMRAFGSRGRYRCTNCKATLFVPSQEPVRSGRNRLLLVVAVAAVLGAVTWAVGYFEAARDAAWKRSVSE